MRHLLHDVRFGLRLLLKNPGFTAVAVLTFALGIAATTAIFSVVHATFFAPLPYRDADRLVMVWSQREGGGRNPNSPADYRDFKRETSVFEDLNAWTGRFVSLGSGGAPMQVEAGTPAPGFLPMLGFGHPLAIGRDFLEAEGTLGREQVVILSYSLWQERFGGDRTILGQAIRIDGKPYEVVGVLGQGPADNIQFRLWIPLAYPETVAADRGARFLTALGRLKPGVTVEQANARLKLIAQQQAADFPDSNRGWTPSVEPFRNNFLSPATKRSLWLLLAAVGFLLLIACANVANLLLARGTARQREVTVRTALGASKIAIVRQLLTESLVLALVGGAVGVALAFLVMRAVVALMPQFMLPSETVIELNMPVLLFTVALSVVSGVLFGTAPAWQATRLDLNAMLKESGRAVQGGRHGLRRALVVLEFALALTLLTGGGVTLWSFTTMARAELGFRTDHLLTFALPAQGEKMVEPDTIRAFYDRVLTGVQALPGVRAAAVSTGLPLQGIFGMPFSIPGQPPVDAKNRPIGRVNVVTPEYLGVMGMRITRGRGITAADRQGGQLVAVVNETFVKRVFGATDPLTQRIELGRFVPGADEPGEPQAWQIVGVVADSRSTGVKNDIALEIHLPFDQSPLPRVWMTVRSDGDPSALHKSIAAVIQRLDPDLPMGNVRTMDQVVAQTLVGDRFTTALFSTFAGVALILAALGIYGVMSFAVAQRTHEIGLRMALGADRGRVLWQVLREGLLTAVAGTILGSAGAWFVVRALRGMVFGASAFAPAAFVGVTLVLLAAALVACLVPATRAASVDPMVALRQD
jgi:putative ABC transport system permease protein